MRKILAVFSALTIAAGVNFTIYAEDKAPIEIETQFYKQDIHENEEETDIYSPSDKSSDSTIIATVYSDDVLYNTFSLDLKNKDANSDKLAINRRYKIKFYSYDTVNGLQAIKEQKVFQISSYEFVTVKTTITNNTSSEKKFKCRVIPYGSSDKKYGNGSYEIISVASNTNADFIYNIYDNFMISNAPAYFKVAVTDITDEANPVAYEAGYLPMLHASSYRLINNSYVPKTYVSFPDASSAGSADTITVGAEQKIPETMLYGTWDLTNVGHTILHEGVTGGEIVLKSDGTLTNGKGIWEFDGDHTVTLKFTAGGDSDTDDIMTMHAFTGYDKEHHENALIMTGADQNKTASFIKTNNAAFN